MPINVDWKAPMNAEFSPKDTEVSDAAYASGLLDDVIGQRGIREPIKSMLERAYRDLSRVNPKWTRRRVRSIWDNEASRIEHREVVEMQALIAARKQHEEYREETARLAALHIADAKDRMGPDGPRMGRMAGGVDRPRAAAGNP